MSNETNALTKPLLAYIREIGIREDSYLRHLREETDVHPMSIMQISPEQGQLMTFLLQLMGARRAIDIGTFTGYSAMCIAKGVGRDGSVVTLDISEEYTSVARRHWMNAGLADRIDLRLGPAGDSLRKMLANEEAGTYDFIFIDADKTGYDAYYEAALELLRPGGVVAIDNILMEGGVIDPGDTSDDTASVRALNRKIVSDNRVSISFVPISDGLTLAQKESG